MLNFFVSIVALAVSALAVLFTKQQAAAAEEQARTLKRQLDQSEQARRDQLQPQIVVDIRPRHPGSQLIALFVENRGATSANNVRIEVNPPLRSSLGVVFEERVKRAVSRPIRALPAGRQLMWNLDIGPRLYERSDLPREYRFTVNASGIFGELEPVTFIIDLDALLGTDLQVESIEVLFQKVIQSVQDLNETIESASAAVREIRQANWPRSVVRRVAGQKRR